MVFLLVLWLLFIFLAVSGIFYARIDAKKGDAKALEALGLPADWSAKARFGAWDSACGATIFIGKTNAERQRLLGKQRLLGRKLCYNSKLHVVSFDLTCHTNPVYLALTLV